MKIINKSRRGIAHVFLIVGGVVALIVVIGLVTGAMSLKGSISYTPKEEPEQTIEKAPSADLPLILEMASPEFYVKYPTNWQVKRQGSNAVIMSAIEGEEGLVQGPAAVFVSSGGMGQYAEAQFSTKVDMWKVQLSDLDPNVKHIEEKDLTIDGHPAHYFEVEYTDNGELFHGRSYIINPEGDSFMYQILATSKVDYWEEYKSNLISAAESFSLTR